MSGTEVYHGGLQQPYRIQKRLVLNQCFKSILASDTVDQTLNYVTFGGEDLYDVMDLVSVFDIRHLELRVLSYEENDSVAVKSRTCPVAANLSRIDTVSVEIVSSSFGDNHRPIQALGLRGPSSTSWTTQGRFGSPTPRFCWSCYGQNCCVRGITFWSPPA